MRSISEKDVEKVVLPGRVVQNAIGKDRLSPSENMTVGYGHFNAANGHPTPHAHAEEVVYIVSAKNAWIHYGPDAESLEAKTILEPGMILHIADGEWHCFDFKEDGHIDLVFFYAGTDNIRPEEK